MEFNQTIQRNLDRLSPELQEEFKNRVTNLEDKQKLVDLAERSLRDFINNHNLNGNNNFIVVVYPVDGNRDYPSFKSDLMSQARAQALFREKSKHFPNDTVEYFEVKQNE